MTSESLELPDIDLASVDPQDVEIARRTVAGKLALASFGEIVSVLMRAPQYTRYALGDLEWLVAPAVLNRQFSLVRARGPEKGPSPLVAVVMWASVSPEIEKRILADVGAPLRLNAKERKSGDRHWITDAVGRQKVIATVVERLRETAFDGKPVKTVVRSHDGQVAVVEI